MPVDSHASKIVFCGGKPHGLDYLLLTQALPLGEVRIRPVGGKFGLLAYIQGYLATYPLGTQPTCIAFRDRDFDAEPPQTPELIPLREGRPLWMSHRAAIENYLIDADLLRQYWTERQDTPRWAHGPALTKDEIERRIQESARDLADYQAVRWALARLRPGTHWPRIDTTWTANGSGDIPSSLDYHHCLDRANRLVRHFRDQVENINLDHLEECAASYREMFNDDHFFEEAQYLIWFHGKDHLAILCRRLAPNFPRRHYAAWAAERVNVRTHADLQQLVDLVR